MQSQQEIGDYPAFSLSPDDGFNLSSQNNRELAEQYEKLKSDMEDLSKKYIFLHSEYSKAYKENQTLSHSMGHLERLLPENLKQQYRAQHGTTCFFLENMQNNFDRITDELRAKNTLLEQQLETSRVELAAYKAKDTPLEQESMSHPSQLVTELEAARMLIKEKDEQLASMATERDTAQAKLAAAVRDQAAAMTEQAKQERSGVQLKKMEDDLNKTREELADLTKDYDRVVEDYDSLKEDHDQALKDLDSMTHQRNNAFGFALDRLEDSTKAERVLPKEKEELNLTQRHLTIEKFQFTEEGLVGTPDPVNSKPLRGKLSKYVDKNDITTNQGKILVRMDLEELVRLSVSIGGELKWGAREKKTVNKATSIPSFEGFSYYPVVTGFENFRKFFKEQAKQFQSMPNKLGKFTIEIDDPHKDFKPNKKTSYPKCLDLHCESKEYAADFVHWVGKDYPLAFNIPSVNQAQQDAKINAPKLYYSAGMVLQVSKSGKFGKQTQTKRKKQDSKMEVPQPPSPARASTVPAGMGQVSKLGKFGNQDNTKRKIEDERRAKRKREEEAQAAASNNSSSSQHKRQRGPA